MLGWETLLAACGGLALGAGLTALRALQDRRRWFRERVELETKVRRFVVPVLERRADVLQIPPSERGTPEDGPLHVSVTLARAIGHLEESADLPFGDTLEVARNELQRAEPRKREGAA